MGATWLWGYTNCNLNLQRVIEISSGDIQYCTNLIQKKMEIKHYIQKTRRATFIYKLALTLSKEKYPIPRKR